MIEKQTQLALDLRYRTAVGREDFLVSPSNEEAVAWVDRWPNWPSPTVVLLGPPGCGKTHLGQVWRQAANAIEYEGQQTVLETDSGPRVFVDNTEYSNCDQEILHLFNNVVSAGGHLLFAVTTPPVRWNNRLPDLTSRLSAAPNIRIHPPDENLVAAVMIKMFADQKLSVSTEVLDYLLNRMERSFEAARNLVALLNNASLENRRGITIPLARQVFEEMTGEL